MERNNVPPVPPPHNGRGGANPNIFPVDDDDDPRGNYRRNDLDGLEDLGGAKVGGAKNAKNKNKNKQSDKTTDYDEEKKEKKEKKERKEKKPPKPVEIRYEGYVLTKLNPPRVEKPTWTKVGKRPLPVDSDALYAKAIQHQKSAQLDVLAHYQRLSPDQQGSITRLLAEKKLEEKDVNADWVLYDVKKLEKDVEISFWRTGRTVTGLRVIIRRQDKMPSSPKKPNTAADYEFDEIIDLSVPLKVPKEAKEGKEVKDGNSKEKKKTKKGNVVKDIDDEILAGIFNDTRHADQYRQNHHAHQQQYPQGPLPQHPDQHHQQYQQPQPHFQEFQQPQHHHQNDPHHGDLFANAPPDALPVPLEHQQNPYGHIPPHAPMPPHTNPFQPEVPGMPEQWSMPPHMNQAHPIQESPYSTARIPARGRSQTRIQDELERQLSREREENDRIRAASRSARERQAEERHARSLSRQRRESDVLRKQQDEIRRLRDDVASVKDKVHHWQRGSAGSSSATSGGDREDFWDRPKSPARYSTPGTSPDRNPRRGSLHRRMSSDSDPRNTTKYYRDRRSSRYPQERVDIIPEYTHRRGDRDYERGRRPQYSDVGFSPPPRPRIVQLQSAYDDYPRRLTGYSESYPEADFDRRHRAGRVDYLRQEPRRGGKGYERHEREPAVYEERRGGGGRRAPTHYY